MTHVMGFLIVGIGALDMFLYLSGWLKSRRRPIRCWIYLYLGIICGWIAGLYLVIELELVWQAELIPTHGAVLLVRHSILLIMAGLGALAIYERGCDSPCAGINGSSYIQHT